MRRAIYVEGVEPLFPVVTEHDTHVLVVMPAKWPLQPLREELRERGQHILSVEKVGTMHRIRCSKPQEPDDEPLEAAG